MIVTPDPLLLRRVDISGFANVAAHFKRMLERPSVKKLFAYEQELNERFAGTG
ncbi:MAG TPA: hypothetical protein VNL14_07225 [Candidatus Acidoferrales bacterium]|nr:hypothetical protein [Candidatus Acidoferrales bacterium]